MLEEIDNIDWDNLTHAYGAASDVPAQIRDLASPSTTVRDDALYQLYGNIFHQGTRYEATPFAVPFLLELANSSETPNRNRIVMLLVNLALGYEETYLPLGFNAREFRKAVRDADAQLPNAAREEYDEYGFGPKVDLDCYEAVNDGIPSLIPLIDVEDTCLKNSVIYALAWFPDHADESFEKIAQELKTSADESTISNSLLAIGLLSKGANQLDPVSTLQPYLSSPSRLIRFSAAIAIARESASEDVVDLLVEATLSTREFGGGSPGGGESEDEDETVLFNEGNVSGYASLTLARGGQWVAARAVPAICKALPSVKAYQSLDLTEALLQLITAEHNKPIRELSSQSLDELTLMGLRAIANSGGWTVGKAQFANYSSLVESYGLPRSQEKLREFLDG